MNTTIGVDTSVSSIPTVTIDDVAVAKAATLSYTFTSEPPTVSQIVNGVVTPSLQVLLFNVLSVIDASVPNKEQNRAIKRLIHDGFDKAYMEILRESFPESNFQLGPGNAVTPQADKFNCVVGTVLKS